ncbi:GNAT family N-acetyltransferase [Thalassospira marina]|uniref:GNAT family N-acetyltransferase n=1 Tax=Thalassospira marina TaxID=2048283 RepID=UPI001FE530E9|nr:N-acetyltransferase [Thalassospira marina]
MLPPDIHIRPEQPGDATAIHALTQLAFAGAAHSDGTEQDIIIRLRERGKLACSLVALQSNDIVGHIAFSPVTIDQDQDQDQSQANSHWYGLGPVSVTPALQGHGIGGALIMQGVNHLQTGLQAGGCVVLGDPAYYGKFGFAPSPVLTFPHAPAEYFMIRSFDGAIPTGIVHYDAAFGV